MTGYVRRVHYLRLYCSRSQYIRSRARRVGKGEAVPTLKLHRTCWIERWARRKRAFAHPTNPLLRRDLPWGGWRVGQIGDQLGVAGLGVVRGLFLDRAV